ncbi:MAG: hypothetical protein ACTSU0_07760 [Alphaproteobacteria bacterium]
MIARPGATIVRSFGPLGGQEFPTSGDRSVAQWPVLQEQPPTGTYALSPTFKRSTSPSSSVRAGSPCSRSPTKLDGFFTLAGAAGHPEGRIPAEEYILPGDVRGDRNGWSRKDHEVLANADDRDVVFVTPAADVSHWTHNTLEQERIQTRLLEIGVDIVAHHGVASIDDGEVELASVFTDQRARRACGSIVLVTSRLPEDDLHYELEEDPDALTAAGIKSVTRIGDCLAPGTIAAAVYGGHRFARELDEPPSEGVPFRRELPQLAND